MSKVICDREDLVAVADGFRSSRGTTDEMTLARMAELAGENAGTNVETCTITFPAVSDVGVFGVNENIYITYLNASGQVITQNNDFHTLCQVGYTYQNVVKGSMIFVNGTSIIYGTLTCESGLAQIYSNGRQVFKVTGDVVFTYADGAPE